MRIGVEMDNYYYSAAAHAVLGRCLPDAEFVDATGLVNWERAVKSERELDYMRTAGRIVTRMHERIAEIAEPGRRKNDVAAEILRVGIEGLPDAGGDYPAIVPLLPSGADASAAHLTWNDAPLRAGEGTFFEIAGCYRRYHCPLCRTVFLGEPPKRVWRAEAALLEAMDEGLGRARAGNTCDDVASAFFGTLEKHGIHKDSRAGYPIGLSYPPDWGERTMSIRRGDRSELRAGMTFHFMTALWFDDWGLEITESIVIGDGRRSCSRASPAASPSRSDAGFCGRSPPFEWFFLTTHNPQPGLGHDGRSLFGRSLESAKRLVEPAVKVDAQPPEPVRAIRRPEAELRT